MSPTPSDDRNKRFQLRVRISAEEQELLENLQKQRGKGETVSDLVREAINLLAQKQVSPGLSFLSSELRIKLERLSELLQRDPRQVEESCVQGIFDLIENKTQIPLLVMETQLYLKYREQQGEESFPWQEPRPSSPSGESPSGDVISPPGE